LRHLLPALAAAYALGISVGDAELAGPATWLWFAVHGAALGVGLRRVRAACALGVAFAAGGLALGARLESARAVRVEEPVEAVVEGRIASLTPATSGASLELRDAAALAPSGRRLPQALRVYAPGPDPPALRAGSWVRMALRVTPVSGRTNPGGPDRARALARRGLGASATALDPKLQVEIEASAGNPLDPFAEFRQRGALRLAAEGAGGGLLAALGLGAAAALAPEPRAALARLGLSHLVAVSGLHLWLVAGPLYLIAAVIARRSAALAARRDTRRLAIGIALAGAAIYALLTGLAAPVLRALAFLALLALAQLARRPLAPASAFGAAGLAVLAVDPAALFAPGVQLSFAATAALVWSAPPPRPARAERPRALERLRDALVLALRTSASATAVTAPLVALHFGVVSPLGWLANGVAVPLTSLVLLPLALAAGLTAASWPAAGGALAAALAGAARIADACLEACVALAAITPARVAVAPGPLALLAAGALAIACVRARHTLLRLALALLAAAAPALGPPPPLEPAAPRVVFLDVGQGDAALVQGRDAAVLIDAGTALETFDAGERVVLPALGALGVTRLDLVVASHADLDHRGGLAAVLRALPVARLWFPPGGRADPAFRELVALARARGVATSERAAGEAPLCVGDLVVQTLWPPRSARPASRNDASLVLRVELARRSLLFPGDLEAEGEARLAARGIDLFASILKLGHHGSRTSSTPAFLAAVSPELAIVSAPRHGRFGMPHAEVVGRLEAARIPWRWTGRDGAVIVGLTRELEVRGFAVDARPRHLATGSTR